MVVDTCHRAGGGGERRRGREVVRRTKGKEEG